MSEFSKKDRLLWSLVNRDTKVLKNRPAEVALPPLAKKQCDQSEDPCQQYKPDYRRQEKQQIKEAGVIRDCAAALASALAAQKVTPSQSVERNFGVQVFQRKKLKKGAIVASLDLHGCSRAQADRAVQDFLYRNYMMGNQWVRIITGKSGVLHSYTPELLRKYANFASGYTYARHDDGGAGALYVRIRRREVPFA
jgi:DNA-nicking Smr family endonuclease